jgi:hypothetical protein
MSDPTGTVGAPSARPASELDMAFEGGPTFLQRVDQLSKARDEAKASLAALKLGNDVKAARDATAREFAAAQMQKAQADEVLKDAQKKAAEIRAAAEADAKGIITVSQQAAVKTRQLAQSVKGDADAYAQARKNEADEALKQAHALQAAATEAKRVADEVTAQSTAAVTAAKRTQEQAEALRASLQAKVQKLQGVLSDVSS